MSHIKIALLILSTFCTSIFAFAKNENQSAVIEVVAESLSDIKVNGASAPTLWSKNGKNFATIEIPTSENWQHISIVGKTKPNSYVYFTLQPEKRKTQYASFFDDVKFNGKHHTDKGFELGKTPDWVVYGAPENHVPQIVPYGAYQGNQCMRVVWTNPVQTRFYSQPDGKFTISLSCKNAGKYKNANYDFPLALAQNKNLKSNLQFGKILNNPTQIKLDTTSAILLRKNNRVKIDIGENVVGNNLYILSATYTEQSKLAGVVCAEFKDGQKKYFEIISAHRTGNINSRTATRFTIPLKAENKKFLYLTKLELSELGNKPDTIELIAKNSDWHIASIIISARNYDTIATFTPTSPDWIKADFGDNPHEISQGSALDFSANVESNAGSKGRIIINKNGKFAFENEPEKSIRFHATMTTFPHLVNNKYYDTEQAKKSIDKQLKNFKQCGYNLLRVWGLEVAYNNNVKNAEIKRQLWDYFMEESRKTGIYIDIMLPLPTPKTPTDWYTTKTNFLLGDKYLNDDWANKVVQILNRKSTISGTLFKDFPHILAIEYINEIGIGPRKLQARGDPTYALNIWRNWLEDKFQSIEKINAMWKTSFKKFGDITAKDMLSRPQWNEFITEYAIRSHNRCESVVRATGYKGLINQYNYDISHTFSAIRFDGTDYVAMNSYHSHPYYEFPTSTWNNWSKNQHATVSQESSTQALARHFRRIAQHKLADRPMILTEHKNCFWNKYQYEDALVFPAYASFQDFSAICSFIRSNDSVETPMGSFTTGNKPIAIVNEVLSYCLFARQDVSPSKHRVEIPISKQILNQTRIGDLTLGWQQSIIPIITGFAITFPEMKTRKSLNHVQIKPADMIIAKDGYATSVSHDFFAEIIEQPNGKFDLKKFISNLKDKNILSSDNISDFENRCYQTDNKQISIFKNSKKIIVNTPRTEGVALLAKNSQKIDALEVQSSSENAMIALTSMDGNPIKNSTKLLLVFSTATLNSNMKLSEDLAFAKEIGTTPALIKTAKLHAKIKLGSNKKYKLYALAINGELRQEIPLKQSENLLEISLDTSKLKHGATPFFLITESKQ